MWWASSPGSRLLILFRLIAQWVFDLFATPSLQRRRGPRRRFCCRQRQNLRVARSPCPATRWCLHSVATCASCSRSISNSFRRGTFWRKGKTSTGRRCVFDLNGRKYCIAWETYTANRLNTRVWKRRLSACVCVQGHVICRLCASSGSSTTQFDSRRRTSLITSFSSLVGTLLQSPWPRTTSLSLPRLTSPGRQKSVLGGSGVLWARRLC
mmetsp:Transcript_5865/g.14870  ORF Transcript_5865/g.14870 Transcript_5865/m.14870 type:complete len:210 (+) Transcript_5865:704-1333(+)